MTCTSSRAYDLRREMEAMAREGKSNQEIIAELKRSTVTMSVIPLSLGTHSLYRFCPSSSWADYYFGLFADGELGARNMMWGRPILARTMVRRPMRAAATNPTKL